MGEGGRRREKEEGITGGGIGGVRGSSADLLSSSSTPNAKAWADKGAAPLDWLNPLPPVAPRPALNWLKKAKGMDEWSPGAAPLLICLLC